MSIFSSQDTSYPNAGRTQRPARCILLGALVLLAAGASAHAQSTDAVDAPWNTATIQAIDAYPNDPTFNHGFVGVDHFAGSNAGDQVGLLTTQLGNGDIVVAGLVPNFGASGTCSNGTDLCNIGLVRYNQQGVRKAWSNPGAYGNYSDNYVIYPGGTGHKYMYLRDIKARGSFIDVLVDELDSDSRVTGQGVHNVRIVTFRDDGSNLSSWPVFGSAGNYTLDTDAFYGAQMVQISATRMIVAATAYDVVGPYVAVTRLTVLGNGAVSQDNDWGDPYGGTGAFDRIRRYYGPGTYCPNALVGGSFCNVTAGYAAVQVGFTTPTDFYVGGSIQIDGDDWDAITLKISSDTGELKSEYNGTGWSRAVFNDPNGSKKDIAAGLYVYQDDVYVAAQVARKCFPGIGLAKLNGANGQYNTAFGSGGKIVFGGQGNTPVCFAPPAGDVPFAISATGGRIGVVGYSRSGITGISNHVDPMLAVVNAVNGTILDFAAHPLLNPDGSRMGDGVFYGVYGGPSPTSPFTAAGNGRNTDAGNTLSYIVGKFIPVSGDRIFANGFDGS